MDGKGQPCPEPATVRLISPEGKPAPGCRMCAKHALMVISEYRVKMGWEWKAEKIVDDLASEESK